jgi:hypothetical protein
MLLAEIREEAIRYGLAKGIVTDENSINYQALDNQIIIGRANVIGKKYISNEKINSQCYRSSLIEYDVSIQDNPTQYIAYEVPRTINGQISVLSGENNQTNIRVVANLAEGRDTIKNQIRRQTRALFDGERLLIYDLMSRNISISALWTDPRELVDFNEQYDQFPFPDMLIPDLVQVLYQTAWQFVKQKPIDTKSDSTETTITPNQK